MAALYLVAGANACLPKGTFVRSYDDEYFLEQVEYRDLRSGKPRWKDKPLAVKIPLEKLQGKVYPIAGVPKPEFVLEAGKVIFKHNASDIILPEDNV